MSDREASLIQRTAEAVQATRAALMACNDAEKALIECQNEERAAWASLRELQNDQVEAVLTGVPLAPAVG